MPASSTISRAMARIESIALDICGEMREQCTGGRAVLSVRRSGGGNGQARSGGCRSGRARGRTVVGIRWSRGDDRVGIGERLGAGRGARGRARRHGPRGPCHRGRGCRSAVQLREPAPLPPVADRVAATRGIVAARGGSERCRTRHHEQPVRVRRGGWPDPRGESARGHGNEGSDSSPDVGRRVGGAPRRSGARDRGACVGLHRTRVGRTSTPG